MKVLLILAAMVASSYGLFVCPPGVCSGVKCAAVTDCSGIVDPTGGFCQCCPVCVQQLAEGQSCAATLLLGSPHTEDCAAGLQCNRTTQVCQKMTCAMVRQHMTANQGTLLGAHIPKCDANGDYAAVQCIGSVCNCVAKTGETIQGYSANIWEIKEMNCNCARDQSTYMKTGLIGKLFYCSTNGNYMKVQCIGSVCHCVDDMGMPTGSTGVSIAMMSTLKC